MTRVTILYRVKNQGFSENQKKKKFLSYHISQIIPEQKNHLECLYDIHNKDIIILGQDNIYKLYGKMQMPLHPA